MFIGRNTTIFGLLANLLLLAVGFMVFANAAALPELKRTLMSSMALALAGVIYAALQFQLRLSLTVLAQRLLLASAFLLWAVTPFLPGRGGERMGTVVIALYVVDMYWMIRNQVNERTTS